MGNSNPPSSNPQGVTPDWEQVVYSKERLEKFARGELTGRELHAIDEQEMLRMALMGFRMYEQGKYEDALTIFRGLASLDPKESYYVVALGAVYLAQGDLEQAERFLSHAIQLNSKEVASFVNRGEVYLRMGRIADAAQDFKSAIALDPSGKDPLTQRARLLAAAALQMIEQARTDGAEGDKAAPKSKPRKK